MKLLTFLCCITLLFGTPLWAAEPVGKVILSFGNNVALDESGESRKLKRQSSVFKSDTVVTSNKGRVQIRFTDGSMLSLRPDTRYLIREYQFDPAEPDEGKAIYKLIKGGMRTITGEIGKVNRENYKVETVVATIGIRGTDYEVVICDAACSQKTGAEEGLHGTVYDGAIAMDLTADGAGGDDNRVDAGGNFLISFGSDEMQSTEETSSAVSDPESTSDEGGDSSTGEEATDTSSEGSAATDDSASENDGSESSEDSSSTDGSTGTSDSTADNTLLTDSTTSDTADSGTTVPANDTQTQPSDPTTDVQGNAPTGSMVAVAFVDKDSTGVLDGNAGTVTQSGNNAIVLGTVDGVGNVPTKLVVYNSSDSCDPCTFDSSNGTFDNTKAGGNGTIGVNWGRWDGSWMVTENGQTLNTAGSFHYIYSDKISSAAVVAARTGSSIKYSKTGATVPTDVNGNTIALGKLDVYVNFDTDTVTSVDMTLGVNGNDTNIHQSGTVSISDFMNGKGIQLQENCTGCTWDSLSGELNGTFVGTNAEGMMTTYGIEASKTGTSIGVSGAALLEDP